MRRRAKLVALSGLDGAGKTTQAEAVRDRLGAQGVDAVVTWTKIASNPGLNVVAEVVKRLLLAGRGRSAPPRRSQDAVGDPGAAVDAGRSLRQRSALLTHGWTVVVACANASWHRRMAQSRHQVVICDRYVLDSIAHLRYRYGHLRQYPVQAALLRWLSPRPLRAYFLDVRPESALARKREQFDLAQLTRLRSLYGQALERSGSRRLDGERPLRELTDEIVADVAAALAGGRRSRRQQ